MQRRSWFALAASVALMAAESRSVDAGLTPIPKSGFPSSSTALSVSGLPSGTEVNGLAVGGLTFGVTVNGVSTNGVLGINSGPGVTNNLTDPAIVSFSNPAGLALVVKFSANESYFGYGFADDEVSTVASATSIQVFENSTSLGSLSYSGSPDPTFTGGFAGLVSTTPFNEVILTFDSRAAAVAVNNFLYLPSVVPEPASASLVLLGTMSILTAVVLKHRGPIGKVGCGTTQPW